MSDTVLRDEIVGAILGELGDAHFAGMKARAAASNILAIPAIKEALAFHESCQKAFAVNGEFTVTKENIRGKGGVSAS